MAGRPTLGRTKKLSLTLPDELWRFIECIQREQSMKQSEALRYIIEQSKIRGEIKNQSR